MKSGPPRATEHLRSSLYLLLLSRNLGGNALATSLRYPVGVMTEEHIRQMIASATRMSLETLRIQHQIQVAGLNQQIAALQRQIEMLERSAS